MLLHKNTKIAFPNQPPTVFIFANDMNIENLLALGLGGNMGNRIYHITWAQQLISQQLGTIVRCSPLYQTAAWGNTDQPNFLNQVVILKTPFSPIQCLQKCLQIEKSMGRKREIKWGPRIIDIDILLYNNIKINTPNLQVPHPHLHERRFVLEPLCDVLPNFKHPYLKKNLSQLLKECPDSLPVTPYRIR